MSEHEPNDERPKDEDVIPESKEPSERSTEEPSDWLAWVTGELNAGRTPGLIQQDEVGKEQEDADP